jgi:hypothetical protein
MPSRKQRRRREKELRHDYEFVYVDEEGREVEADEVPQPSRNGRAATPARKQQRGRGSARVVEPASWHRAIRRGLLFSPAMFAILYLLNRGNAPIYAVVFNTAILVAFFIPFGYLMDRVMHRTYLRRQAGAAKKR